MRTTSVAPGKVTLAGTSKCICARATLLVAQCFPVRESCASTPTFAVTAACFGSSVASIPNDSPAGTDCGIDRAQHDRPHLLFVVPRQGGDSGSLLSRLGWSLEVLIDQRRLPERCAGKLLLPDASPALCRVARRRRACPPGRGRRGRAPTCTRARPPRSVFRPTPRARRSAPPRPAVDRRAQPSPQVRRPTRAARRGSARLHNARRGMFAR